MLLFLLLLLFLATEEKGESYDFLLVRGCGRWVLGFTTESTRHGIEQCIRVINWLYWWSCLQHLIHLTKQWKNRGN